MQRFTHAKTLSHQWIGGPELLGQIACSAWRYGRQILSASRQLLVAAKGGIDFYRIAVIVRHGQVRFTNGSTINRLARSGTKKFTVEDERLQVHQSCWSIRRARMGGQLVCGIEEQENRKTAFGGSLLITERCRRNDCRDLTSAVVECLLSTRRNMTCPS